MLYRLFCPLSHQLISEPVVDPEGQVYDRRSIEAHLAREGCSPWTQTPLLAEALRFCFGLFQLNCLALAFFDPELFFYL